MHSSKFKKLQQPILYLATLYFYIWKRFEEYGDVYVAFILHKPLVCIRSPEAVKTVLNGAGDVYGRSDWFPFRYIFGQRFFSAAFLLSFQRKSLLAFGHRKSMILRQLTIWFSEGSGFNLMYLVNKTSLQF